MFYRLARQQIVWKNVQRNVLSLLFLLLLFINHDTGVVWAEGQGVPVQTTSYTLIEVSTPKELLEALRNSTGGEKIVLKSGSYGSLNLYGGRQPFVKFPREVIITSEDPQNRASFSLVDLSGVSNLTFDNITFDYVAEAGENPKKRTVQVRNSSKISIKNSSFDGDFAHGSDAKSNGFGTGYGLFVGDGSHDILIEKNEFFNWLRAGIFDHSEKLIVRGNDVHDVRSDGFDFAAVSHVLIEGNYFHDFRKSILSKDHMDMIQFWTNGTDSPNHHIIIRRNFLNSGKGYGTQSIFMRNEEVDRGRAGKEMYYQYVVIQDNVIYNAHSHGITIGESAGLRIINNTILHNFDGGNSKLVSVPTIRVADKSTNVLVAKNIVPRLGGVTEKNESFWANNLVVQRNNPNAENYVGNIFVNGLADSTATFRDLIALPEGIVAKYKLGSSLTQFNTAPSKLSGFVTDKPEAGFDRKTHKFSASNIYGPNGKLAMKDVSVNWTFGDGNTAEGVDIKHTYKRSGRYNVKAKVAISDGRSIVLERIIKVETPMSLNIDFDENLEDLSEFKNPVSFGEMVTVERGLQGNAVRLNGGVISYKTSLDFIGNSEYTVLFDFKKDRGNKGASGRVIYFGNSFVIGISRKGLSATITTSLGNTRIKTGKINMDDTRWHNVALVFSGKKGTAILYLDGIEVGRQQGLGKAIQTGKIRQDFHIGDPRNKGFSGLIDNVMFVRAAFSDINELITRIILLGRQSNP